MSRFAAKARPGSRVDEWSPRAVTPARYAPSFWLDAADPATFTYSSGTVVSQWDDKSGNGFHVSQGTGAAQPSRSGTRNGKSTVVFDGGDVLSYTGTTGINVGTMTIFVVAGESSTVNNAGICVLHSGAGDDFGRQDSALIQCAGSTSASIRGTRFSTGATGYSGAGLFGRPFSYSVFCSLFGSDGFLGSSSNGVPGSQGEGRAGTFTTATGGFLIAGRYLSGAISASFRFNGEIAEIIIYSRVLTYIEQREITDYLMYKWGI